MTMTNDAFNKFIELIFKKTGIWFDASKNYFVEKRITDRMNELGIDNSREYYQLLKFAIDEGEWNKFINCLTVNETYFFRDFPQLQGFAENSLMEVAQRKTKLNKRTLKFWSAGCASGEEAYTLAIILMEMLDEPDHWQLEIAATDINTTVLGQARQGLYSSRSVKDVPPEYLEKYFTPRGDKYLLNLKIRNMVNFKSLNLIDEKVMEEQAGFDFIFCRNVLIYFNDVSRRKVLHNFYRAMGSGGYIFLGYSESVGRITDAFKLKRVAGNIVYYKP